MRKMHRNLLRALNSLLAAFITMLGVTSCQAQKKVVRPAEDQTVDEQPQIMVKYGVPFRREEQIVTMYGIRWPGQAETDSELPADTTELNAAPAETEAAMQVRKQEAATPLVLLNGKEIPFDSFHALNPDNLADITILEPEDAQKKYGEKAKDGAIVIRTKSGK